MYAELCAYSSTQISMARFFLLSRANSSEQKKKEPATTTYEFIDKNGN